MKSSTTLFLLAVTLGLAAYIYFVERKEPGTRAILAASPVEFDLTNALGITLSRGGETLELELDGKIWKITRPLQDRANQKVCEELLAKVGALSVREIIEDAEVESASVNLSEFGLARDQGTGLSINGDDGPMLSMLVGDSAALEGTSYISFPGQPERPHIYLVNEDLNALVTRPIISFRDLKALSVNPQECDRLRIRTGDKEIEIERDARSGLWKLLTPLQSRADQDAVDEFLAAVAALEIETFIDSPDSAATGAQPTLEKSSHSVSIWPRDAAEGEPGTTLALRAGEGDEGAVVASVSDRDARFKIPASVLELLSIDPGDLRDPHLAQIPEDFIRGIIVQSRDDPDVILTTNGTIWLSLRGGKSEGANEERIQRFLKNLNREKVADFVTDSSRNLGEFALDPPSIRVGLTTSLRVTTPALITAAGDGLTSDSDAFNYVLGLGLVRGRKDGEADRLYARFAGEPSVVAIDPSFLNFVPTHPLKWKGLKLISFSVISLREIAIHRPGDESVTRLRYDYLQDAWSLERNGEDLSASLNLDKARALADFLGEFSARDWLTKREAAYRVLENPVLTVEIILGRPSEKKGGGPDSEDRETTVFSFAPAMGDPAESGESQETKAVPIYYGRRGDSPDIFLVTAGTFERLATPLVDKKP